MRKVLLLVCALLISFSLLFLPFTEARALLQKGSPCSRGYTPCTPPSPPN
ncbi:hypothetical protein ACJRO7_027586 [Eucalyptus globulus]|uniref:Uncharacterized protein n=1 Tax=Eucalyptus globulus TaxID=34317 RepID=A0ABD3K1W8_EUCGL